MSDNSNNNSGKGWEAGIGAALGALVGESGVFGGGNRAGGDSPASVDQVQASFNALRDENQNAGISHQINHLAGAIGGVKESVNCSISGVKDAVISGSQAAALAHCNLGNQMAQGFASVNTSMATHFGDLKTQMLQQALDAERARATELRIELSEHRNQAGHASTQVLLNQVIAQGKA